MIKDTNTIDIYCYTKYKKDINSLEISNTLLEKYYGKEYFCIKNNKGKPIVNQRYSIGIAHPNNIIIIGISELDIGIDIEISRKLSNLTIELFMSKEDYKDINYISLWNIKEAFLKKIGIGLQIDPRLIIVSKKYVALNNIICFYKCFKLFNNANTAIVTDLKNVKYKFLYIKEI